MPETKSKGGLKKQLQHHPLIMALAALGVLIILWMLIKDVTGRGTQTSTGSDTGTAYNPQNPVGGYYDGSNSAPPVVVLPPSPNPILPPSTGGTGGGHKHHKQPPPHHRKRHGG